MSTTQLCCLAGNLPLIAVLADWQHRFGRAGALKLVAHWRLCCAGGQR